MRKPRYYYESNFYHIMIQGDEKKNIFKSDKNKKRMIYLLKHNAFRNEIAKLLKMSRSTMILKPKKAGIK